jgi:hypothetical protein
MERKMGRKMDVTIPKTIHLCWFSGDAYPPLIAKCLHSWEREMPDYTVRVWTLRDVQGLGLPFVDEALSVRKWAFAADVVRLYALYHEGGVYLDSDFYVKRDLTPLLTEEFVSAVEQTDHGIYVQPAFMASVKGHPYVGALLDFYRDRHFILPDGSYDMKLIAPDYYTQVATRFGFRPEDCTQQFGHILIHPSRLIAPNPGADNPSAYGIHACEHSWIYDGWLLSRLRRVKRAVMKWLSAHWRQVRA